MSAISGVNGPGAVTPRPANDVAGVAARPLDPSKLDALKAAIQAGRYPLDATKLAERIAEVGLGRSR